MDTIGKYRRMKKKADPVIEFKPYSSKNSVKPLEIHNGKIIPQQESHPFPGIPRSRENEWQQEYYIIYNSYVIEQSDN